MAKLGAFLCLAGLFVLSLRSSPSQRELSVGSGSQKIEGVLFSPVGPAEAVCIVVPGSGPVMRDGRLGGLPASRPVYAELAASFADRGIATFIYQKRWIVHPELARTFTEEDHLADLAAVVGELQKQQISSRLVVFGHSEGGALAVVLAGRRKEIAAVVVAASAGFPIDELLLEQLKHNPLLKREVAALIVKMRDGSFPVGGVMLGASRDYWTQWMDFTANMADYTRRFSAPILVVQGGADASLPGGMLARNLSAWRKIASERPGVEVKEYSCVDHFLVDASTQELSKSLVDDAAAFLLAKNKAETGSVDAHGSEAAAQKAAPL